MIREFTTGTARAVLCGMFVVALSAQEPLRFEVASIRPSPSQPVGPIGVRVTQSEARFIFTSLKAYICAAFDLRDHQVDGPQWLSTTRFDIVAKRPEGQHGLNQVPGMLQALLAEISAENPLGSS